MMLLDINIVLDYTLSGITIASIIAVLLCTNIFLKLKFLIQKMVLYILIGSIVEIASWVVAKFFHTNNLFFFHGFAIFEAWVLSLIFFELYQKYNTRLQVRYALIPLVSFLIINSLFVQPIYTFNSNGLTVVSLVAISYSFYAFYLMLEKEIDFPHFSEVKWFIVAIFVTHCGSLMVELFSNQMLNLDKAHQQLIWFLRSFIMLGIKFIYLYIAVQLQKSYRFTSDGK
jgi:hypothetical protein